MEERNNVKEKRKGGKADKSVRKTKRIIKDFKSLLKNVSDLKTLKYKEDEIYIFME